MNTIGHHTCLNEGSIDYLLSQTPFLSNKTEGKVPFLGVGYYFWDDNIKQAHKWGVDHYNRVYCIVEFSLQIDDNIFLDLVGNRAHSRYFYSLLGKFEKRGIKTDKWKIGEFIEFLKNLRQSNMEIFPFNIVRAQDFLPKMNDEHKFNFNQTSSFTYLDQRVLICYFKREDIISHHKQIVFKT